MLEASFIYYFLGSYRTPPSLRKLQYQFFEGEGVAELWTFSGTVMGSNEKIQKEKIISKTTRQCFLQFLNTKRRTEKQSSQKFSIQLLLFQKINPS